MVAVSEKLFFLLFIYLFICLCQVLIVAHESLLWHVESFVAAFFIVAYGSWFPNQGLILDSLNGKHGVLAIGPQRSPMSPKR